MLNEQSNEELEPLTDLEVDQVAGGIAPAVIAVGIIGLHLIAVGLAIRDLKSRR